MIKHHARYLRRRLGATVLIVSAALAPGIVVRPAAADDPILGPITTLLDTTAGLLEGAVWGYGPSSMTLPQVTRAIDADPLYAKGVTGRGVGVALIDTGTVPVPGLTSGNVVSGPDLSFDSQHSSARYLDAFGHGTHLAGIIAGRDPGGTGFRGVAPDATLLDVRVGASDGAVDVTQVLAAIDWVVAHRQDRGLNIRVLALAFGTDSTLGYASNPLDLAVENAWKAGITVVVSGGNKGSRQASLDVPAHDPYVIAVGAADTAGTDTVLDDHTPDFSSRGSATRRVDLIAPGQSIVSLRDPGSYVDVGFPKARVDSRFFKGSGTSQAAAVAAGAVALLLQGRSWLRPDQVKGLLMATARKGLLTDPTASGAGLIDVAGAAGIATVPSGQHWPASTGRGSLEAARGSVHVVDHGVALTGERDIFGRTWQPATWATASAAGTSWVGGAWNAVSWAGTCWCATSWAGTSWGLTWWWKAWSGEVFAHHAWSSQSWSSQSWSGSGWVSQSWSSQSWSSQSWSGASWPDAS